MQTNITYIHAYIHVYVHMLNLYMCIGRHAWIYKCAHTYINTHITHIYVCMYICECI